MSSADGAAPYFANNPRKERFPELDVDPQGRKLAAAERSAKEVFEKTIGIIDSLIDAINLANRAA